MRVYQIEIRKYVNLMKFDKSLTVGEHLNVAEFVKHIKEYILY